MTTIADLETLQGQELGVGPWVEITQERVNAFADATGDHQWIHVDPERAARSPFRGTIAHGFLTLSLLPWLQQERGETQLDLGQRMAINYGLNRVRFPGPVRVGQRIRLRTTLRSVERLAGDAVQVVQEHVVEREGETKPAVVAETITRYYM